MKRQHMPVIICAVCNKPVDRWEVDHSFKRDCEIHTVWCHGEKESTEIDAFTRMEAFSIKGGTAFNRIGIIL